MKDIEEYLVGNGKIGLTKIPSLVLGRPRGENDREKKGKEK